MTTIDISASKFIPLSAHYGLNDNIVLDATLFEFNNGFNLIQQPIFTNTQDIAIGNSSFLSITPLRAFYDFANAQNLVDKGEFVIFTGLKNKKSNKYITNIDNVLYANAIACNVSEFFKIYKTSTGVGYYVSQNNLYATVVLGNGKWDIVMSEKLIDDPYNTQKFYVSSNQTLDTLTIKSMFTVPQWSSKWTVPIERFWSYSSITSAVRSNGLVYDDDYLPENNYCWLTTIDVGLFAIGFDCDIKWVKYYNEIGDKRFNSTVDIKEVVRNIPLNYLVSCPYEKLIQVDNKTGKMGVNISNLKNIATPENNYGDV